ncbi:MAG: OmpH family outer membrane protein, partial [Deltaproteobacteria bacterium]|nr:OmpH family outer membrane protein [Deltaproteobacteria bacterium]
IFSFQLIASAAEPTKIGVLDLQKCMQESNEGKRQNESLQKKQNDMLDELRKKDQELRDMQSDMEKQSLMLSADAKENKIAEFEKKKREYDRRVNEAREDLQIAARDAQITMLNIISGVVENIAKQKKFDLIIEKSNGGILYFSNSLDITADVIAELNKLKP